MLLIGGEDTHSSKLALQKTIDRFKKEFPTGEVSKYYADEVGTMNDIPQLVGGIGLFSQKSLVVITNLLSTGSTGLRDLIWESLEKGNHDQELVLFESGKIDRRSKLYKFFTKKNKVIEYKIPTPGEKRTKIITVLREKGINIKSALQERLFTKLESLDYNQIENELWKLSLLLEYDGKNEVEEEDLAMINYEVEEEVWNLFETACKNKSKAFALLENLFAQQIHFSIIIGYLASQLRQIIQYKYVPNDMNPFIKRRVGGLANNFSKQRLSISLNKLYDLDLALKSTKLDPLTGLSLYLTIL